MKILNIEPLGYSPTARSVLESFAWVDDGPLDRSKLLEKIKHYDCIIVRLGHRIDADVLQAAPRLKTIVTATTGLNHIDLEEARKRGIEILSLAGERQFLDNIFGTAEHTWAMLLSLFRKIPQARSHVIDGGWDRDRFRGHELSGRTLGIIGLGRLGTRVALYGIAFGMQVLTCDIRQPATIPEDIRFTDMDEVLSESDVISVHVNYTPGKPAIIGTDELHRMKQGAVLVNTSRGELIDETALLDELGSGRLAGAALDVLIGENSPQFSSNPLIAYAKNHPNVIITPHIGGCTFESMEKTEIFMAEKLRNYIAKI